MNLERQLQLARCLVVLFPCFFPSLFVGLNILLFNEQMVSDKYHNGRLYLFNIRNYKDQQTDNKGPWVHLWLALVTNVVGVSTLIDHWLKIGTSAGISAVDSHDKPPGKQMR